MGRCTKNASRMRKKRSLESPTEKLRRKVKNQSKTYKARESETETERYERLCKQRALFRSRLLNESASDKARRLQVISNRLTNETEEKRVHRLEVGRAYLSSLSESQRDNRLKYLKEQQRNRLSAESLDDRTRRLQYKRQSEQQHSRLIDEQSFERAVNVLADEPCAICNKALYPQQRNTINAVMFSSILPLTYLNKGQITACFRCSTHLKRHKTPPQALFNQMKASDIPPELAALSDLEQRLLSRVVPFMKIIKLNNRFSQNWCKGQVVLFAQDVIELAEQLPLQISKAGIFIIAENLQNVERCRQFQVNMDQVKMALEWLLKNNSLYKDVRPSFTSLIDATEVMQQSLIRDPKVQDLVQTGSHPQVRGSFKELNEHSAILRGSLNQASVRFNIDSRGKQCTAIAAVACTAFHSLDPFSWQVSDVDDVVITGDSFYHECIATAAMNPSLVSTGYLSVYDLCPELRFNNHKFILTPVQESSFHGHIDRDNSVEGFPNLFNALGSFAASHMYGILTANSTSVALHCKASDGGNMTYWLFDSHSRGPKGFQAAERGVACCMRFYSIDSLYHVVRKNLRLRPNSKNGPTINVYDIVPFTVQVNDLYCHEPFSKSQKIQSSPKMPLKQEIDMTIQHVIYSTSMLTSVDDVVPDINTILDIPIESLGDKKLVNIHRKTAPPVNIDRERRIEELGFFTLFPDGKNGFGEPREIPITPLDYFQARIMSLDSRFHRNDYMFFALSVVEFYRAKSSVSVSCQLRQVKHTPQHLLGSPQYLVDTPQHLVDNMHLTMRNIRGSASYWKRCCSELIAMVRCLGPPTWFVTFSCNDLNWPDMLRALLVADGRNVLEADNLSYHDRLSLVERFPVVVSRHFTVRINALVRFLKHRPDLLGGKMEDFWYRVEFQNRGSPHLHMLIWCADVPDFLTRAGIDIIERVVSCSINPADNEMKELVKNCQRHKHTNTCFKNRTNGICRFGFPRPVNEATTCLGPDETLTNNGRFCLLKRSPDELMINNYNPELLRAWKGNIDIQPCGNVTAVSYYVAKYASKCEPHETGDVIKEAVLKAKKSGGSLWNQLFAVSMSILSQRLISASECAFRLCHLPLKMSSRKTVFVNSCSPDQRFRLLRFGRDNTSIYNNLFDRYVLRPDNLENISLAEFAVRYEIVSGKTWTEEDGDEELVENVDSEPAKYIHLKDNTRMRVRNRAAVLRTRYYTLNSDREGYYYNLIVCHIPFRAEGDLMLPNESAETCFIRRKDELRPLLNNVTTEQFAHAEQVIQAALAQAIALNIERDVENGESCHNVNLQVPNPDEDILNDLLDDVNDRVDGPQMTDEMYYNAVRCLNVQQRDLFKNVSKTIVMDLKCEFSQLLLFTTGGAGSGKSFILKLIVEHIKRCYSPTIDPLLKPIFIEVTALTGVAARQIFGRTLHSVFSLPIEKGKAMTYHRMSGQRLEQERRKWQYIKWLVIDEISMVSYENLRIVHLRLQEFKNNDKLFGGIHVLLFGDIMQLPPVKGHWCFAQPPWCAAEINLWHQFSFCEMTTNMRQHEDTEFIDLLNNLRVGEMTVGQLQILCERRRVPLTGDFQDGKAVRIFPTVKLVDEYNLKMTSSISKSRVYHIRSVDESRESATYGKTPPANVIPSDPNSCGGLLHHISITEGSRVMLRRNMSVTEGLVNGAMGIVKGFKWPALRRDQLEDGELPDAVFVEFDDETIGGRIKDANGFVAIAPVSATFQASKGYGDVERRMLPLILSWAVTVHKLQGTTLNRAVIDLGKRLFAKGQAYVALSRVKTLEGIALCDLEPERLLVKPHDERSLVEMNRLRSLSTEYVQF